jgi:pimeloyl-ACP methyl ester carboxylesterase
MWSATLNIDGPAHVAEWGSGPVRIVLVHGLGGSHLNWMRVAPQLTRYGRVLAPDLPGFGRTPAAGHPTTVGGYADFLDRVIDQTCTEPVVLVGNSMGGLVALAEAARHPQRVAGLVLVDAVLPGPWRRRRPPLVVLAFVSYLVPTLGRWVLHHVRDRLSVEDLVAGAIRLLAQRPELIPADVIEAHIELERERGRSRDNDAAYVQAAHSIAGALVNRVGFRRLIGRVSAPTLIVHGDADRLVRADAARKAQRRRRDWELHVLDDVGHIPMLEVPHQFLEILNAWLPSHVRETPPRPVAPAPASSSF